MEEREIWKPIKGYEGRYEVSNIGRVKSLNYLNTHTESLLSLCKNESGYLQVGLYIGKRGVKRYVHRLVYEAFVGELPVFNPTGRGRERMEINHIDENPLNNRVENLELVSHKDNNNYGKHYQKISKKNRNGIMSKKVYQYTKDGSLVRTWESTAECGRNGFRASSVCSCCHNKYHGGNVYKGFIWLYEKI